MQGQQPRFSLADYWPSRRQRDGCYLVSRDMATYWRWNDSAVAGALPYLMFEAVVFTLLLNSRLSEDAWGRPVVWMGLLLLGLPVAYLCSRYFRNKFRRSLQKYTQLKIFSNHFLLLPGNVAVPFDEADYVDVDLSYHATQTWGLHYDGVTYRFALDTRLGMPLTFSLKMLALSWLPPDNLLQYLGFEEAYPRRYVFNPSS